MRVKQSLTTSLVVLISLFFVAAQFDHQLVDQLCLFYGGTYSNGYFPGVSTGQWYRLLTVALTHANILHLATNMWALYSIGNLVESIFGRSRYMIIFTLSLLTASLTSVYLGPHNIPGVGASGAIFGLFGALLVVGKRVGIDYRSVVSLVVLNLIITFSVPNIDWHAHLGGLLGGALTAAVIARRKRV